MSIIESKAHNFIFSVVAHSHCFFFLWKKKLTPQKKIEILQGLKIDSLVTFCKILHAHSRVTQKFHEFFSAALFVFPKTVEAVVCGGFFSRWCTGCKLQKYTGGIRRKSAKYDVPYPKSSYDKDRRSQS